jgi:hypothetical protein
VPSHDTLNDVVNALDPGTFEECFEAWIGAIRELVPKNWTDGLALDLISNPRERIRRR